ncbi:MAG: prepilin peptidase [Candidatus Omnitrophica bacterium]|nr:prepilin peptidase [Candidatus Omnitrophota bacterium]
MEPEILWGTLFFMLGAVIGSFLNVCIVRLPQEKSVVFPGSHCVKCGKPVRWFDNIPILSYFILWGKCRDCGAKFSVRYAFVEFLTGCVFLGFYLYYGLSWLLLPYLLMTAGFIVATFVDFEHRIIPDEVSVGGMFAGIALSLLIPALHASADPSAFIPTAAVTFIFVIFCLAANFLYFFLQKTPFQKEDAGYVLVCLALVVVQLAASFAAQAFPATAPWSRSLASSVQGALIGGGAIYFMGVVGEWIFKKEAMGGGDVKLLAMIGAFLGWKLAILTFFVAPFFGAIVGIVEKIRTKDSAIAYGPYLVLGALVSLFCGDRIIHWIMTGYGVY